MKKNILALALIAALGLSAQAATEQQVTVGTTVPSILSLEVSQASIDIALVDADYSSGASLDTAVVTSSAAHTFSVRANVPWTVSVKAGAATFTGPVDTAKPAGDLEVQTPSATFAALTTTDRALESGVGGGFADNTFNVDYRLTSTLGADAPGAYSLSVVYTVAAN